MVVSSVFLICIMFLIARLQIPEASEEEQDSDLTACRGNHELRDCDVVNAETSDDGGYSHEGNSVLSLMSHFSPFENLTVPFMHHQI